MKFLKILATGGVREDFVKKVKLELDFETQMDNYLLDQCSPDRTSIQKPTRNIPFSAESFKKYKEMNIYMADVSMKGFKFYEIICFCLQSLYHLAPNLSAPPSSHKQVVLRILLDLICFIWNKLFNKKRCL